MGLFNKKKKVETDEIYDPFDKIDFDFDYSTRPPDHLGEIPDCPICGSEMLYNDIVSRYKCTICNHKMDDDDLDYDSIFDDYYSDDVVPFGCKACGGPYPNCKISCKIFDD